MTLFCKTHCHSPLVQWRHLLTSLAALKLENISLHTKEIALALYTVQLYSQYTSSVSGTTRGSGDTAVKKADMNPFPHGTHSVAMTNPITGMIWPGSYKAIQLTIYMQVQKISHPTEEVWGTFTTKSLSGLAKRWLTHTRYGQNTSTKHMYWSKKIENNQIPHLISHSHTENVILFGITPLGSRRQIWAEIYSSHAAFFWRSY